MGSTVSFHTDSFFGGCSEVSLTNGNATTTTSPEVSVYQIDSAYTVNGDCAFYVLSSVEK